MNAGLVSTLGLSFILPSPPTGQNTAFNFSYPYIVCTKVSYSEPMQPMNDRGEETREFEITVQDGSSLERIARDLKEINRSEVFDQYMRNEHGIGKDSYFWRDFNVTANDLYERNKELIGDKPNLIKTGMKLKYRTPTVILPGTFLSL